MEEVKEKPLLVLKADFINAIVPTFFKNLFLALFIGLPIFGIFYLLARFEVIPYPISSLQWWLIGFVIVFTAIFITIKLIVLYNTSYLFYDTYVAVEFEFIKVKRNSTPYNQIVKVTSHETIWDRFCNAGDLTMHTANEQLPDLTLMYIKNPQQMENDIYNMVERHHNKEKTV